MDSSAHCVWQGDLSNGSGVITLDSRAVAPFQVSWPSRAEASNGHTSPEELIAAAHASCFNMALSSTLAGGDTPPNQLETSAVATFGKTADGFSLTTMKLTVIGDVPGISADQFSEAAAAAKDGCPVSNALKGNVEITVDATLTA